MLTPERNNSYYHWDLLYIFEQFLQILQVPRTEETMLEDSAET